MSYELWVYAEYLVKVLVCGAGIAAAAALLAAAIRYADRT
jgi:hypothetical protein